jgi:hypothetical protein
MQLTPDHAPYWVANLISLGRMPDENCVPGITASCRDAAPAGAAQDEGID